MAIYSKSGSALASAYSLTGEIAKAYNKSGDIVYGRDEPDYTNYTITRLFRFPLSFTQSFATYNGVIAQVILDDSLYLIDMDTQSLIRQVEMDFGHGNSCQFSDEFYSENDEFPLFYVVNEDVVFVYRIVGTSSTLIKKYTFPQDKVLTYVTGFGIDNENRLFYTASYTEGDYITKTGLVRICKWDMDTATNNGDGTYTMSFISSHDNTWFDRYNAVQGCCYHDGYFFITSGYVGQSQQDIVMIDDETLSIAYTIDCGIGQESEGCAWNGDDYLILGQREATYTYQKIEFARD